MAKDRYKEKRDKQEAKKKAEIRELQEEVMNKALDMNKALEITQPPIPMRKQDDDIYDDESKENDES